MTEAGIEKWNYLPLLFSFSLYAVAAQMKVKNKKKYGEMIIESNYSGAMRKAVMMYEVRIEKKKKHENEINTFDFDSWIISTQRFLVLFPATNRCRLCHAPMTICIRDMLIILFIDFEYFFFLSECDRYGALVCRVAMMLPFKLNHNKVENCDSRDGK